MASFNFANFSTCGVIVQRYFVCKMISVLFMYMMGVLWERRKETIKVAIKMNTLFEIFAVWEVCPKRAHIILYNLIILDRVNGSVYISTVSSFNFEPTTSCSLKSDILSSKILSKLISPEYCASKDGNLQQIAQRQSFCLENCLEKRNVNNTELSQNRASNSQVEHLI